MRILFLKLDINRIAGQVGMLNKIGSPALFFSTGLPARSLVDKALRAGSKMHSGVAD